MQSTLPKHIAHTKDIDCEINEKVNLSMLDDDTCPAIDLADSNSDLELLDGPLATGYSKQETITKTPCAFHEMLPPSTHPSTTRRSQVDCLIDMISLWFNPEVQESHNELWVLRTNLREVCMSNDYLYERVASLNTENRQLCIHANMLELFKAFGRGTVMHQLALALELAPSVALVVCALLLSHHVTFG